MERCNHDGTCPTQERILEAACEVFAEKGYRNATVREIVGKANANLNAVNYHFGDKEGLYLAVIEHVHTHMDTPEHLGMAGSPTATPEERLRAFVRSFISRALDKGEHSRLSRLMAFEMSEPTEALDMIVARFIRPRFEFVCSIVRDLLGPQVCQRTVELCGQCIVGQCMHYVRGKPIISRLIPWQTYDQASIEQMTDQIIRFSLAALRNLPAEQGEVERCRA